MKDATPFPCTLSTVHTPQSIDGSGFMGCAASPNYGYSTGHDIINFTGIFLIISNV
jgi:hypothetical protein